jgi:two-component system, chemotaxis family, chemotaxis protein CheY
VQALVVDDSRAVRMMLKRMLTESGFDTVSEAGHGLEALERLGESIPDVMLVDWNMPEMNGIELLRAVRATDEYRGIPVVMVTTETEASQVVRALAAGASDYVMKPFTKDIILEKLELLGIVPPPDDV